MSQQWRSLILSLPLHNQLTLRNPLAWFKLICILPGDLEISQSVYDALTYVMIRMYEIVYTSYCYNITMSLKATLRLAPG